MPPTRKIKEPVPAVVPVNSKGQQIRQLIVGANAYAVKNNLTTPDRPLFGTVADYAALLGPPLKTGNPYMDFLLGGGLPRGCSSKWWGAEGTGKTTLALSTAGEILKDKNAERYVLWVQAEDGDPRNALPMFGIDPADPRFIFYRAQGSGEQILDQILNFLVDGRIPRNLIDLVVLDSLAALDPVDLLESGHKKDAGTKKEKGPEGSDQPGRVAAMYAKWFRRLHSLKAIGTGHMVLISQARCGLDPYGSKEISVGGKSTDHAARIVLKFMKESGGAIVSSKDNNKMLGHSVKITFTKDGYRHRLQGSTFLSDVYYQRGFDKPAQYHNILLDTGGLIETSAGRWNVHPNIIAAIEEGKREKYEKFWGKDKVKAALRERDFFLPASVYVDEFIEHEGVSSLGEIVSDPDIIEDTDPEDQLSDMIRDQQGTDRDSDPAVT